MNVTVELPELHPTQRQVAADPTRFRVIACGRRWGKTYLAVALAMRELLRGGSTIWVAPTYDKASIGWRLFLALSRQMPFLEVRRAERKIFLRDNWIGVYSADSEGGIRGEGPNLVVVDECAHIRDFRRIWEQELRPALTDRKGKAVFISTPYGHNYFYDFFQLGASGDPDWRSFQFPSSANPHLDPAEIESARAHLPALVFRQEYGAEFVQLSGALFSREWFIIVDEPPANAYRARFWDLAVSTKTSGNYTVGALVAFAPDGIVCVLDIARGRWEWPDALRVIAQTARSDGPTIQVGVEAVGVQAGMAQQLSRDLGIANIAIYPVPVVRDKVTRALPLIARAEQGKLHLLRGEWNQVFIDELCAFPESQHDDQVDAVSGALQLLADTTAVFAEVL